MPSLNNQTVQVHLELDTGDLDDALAKARELADHLAAARAIVVELAGTNGHTPEPAKEPPPPVAKIAPQKASTGERRPRRKHSAEDKARGVALAKKVGVTKAAEELDVVPSVVRTWIRNHPKEHAVKGSIEGSGPKVGESHEAWEARARAAAGAAL